MNKYTVTSVFGMIGAFSWSGTVLLRETIVNDINIFNDILGIMPNISACWVFIWIGEKLVNKTNNSFTFKLASIISAVIFLLAIASEIVHEMFLSSSFDVNDIIATVLAIFVYLISFYISKCKMVIKK